jgi:hypothetical protein
MPPPAPTGRRGGRSVRDDNEDAHSSSSAQSSPDQRARDLGMHRRRQREDRNEDSSGSEVDEERDQTMSVSCALSEALASDITAQRAVGASGADEESTAEGDARAVATKESSCCVCGDKAQYTCPGCKKRTCSLTCVRMHKAHDKCSGERNVTGSVPLAEFSDAQLRRDYHFLEDCRRVADTAASRRPKDGFHYSYHALPPPLYALRESAKIRGVLLQLISEGLRKRDVNATRYDKRTDTITWHVEFRFVSNVDSFLNGTDAGTTAPTSVQGLRLQRNFMVATSWGNERHLLGDVLTACARVNPKLPLFHIRRGYSRASRWVAGGDLQARSKRTRQTTSNNDEAETTPGIEQELVSSASEPVEVKICEATPELVLLPDNDPVHAAQEEEVPMTAAAMVANTNVRRFIEECGGVGGLHLLHRAERLGDRVMYFPMNLRATLHENLRTLFFLNEFPEFLVVRNEDLARFDLVSDADKESIRESFRKKERPTLQQRLSVLPKKADLDDQTAELYAKIPCRQFVRGACVRPEGECPYWHCAPSEVPACRHMVLYGECTKGKKCSFQHDADVVAAAKREMAANPQEHFGRGGRGAFRGGRGGGRGGQHGGFTPGQHRNTQPQHDAVPGVILTSSTARPAIHIALPAGSAAPLVAVPNEVPLSGPRFIQPPTSHHQYQ